MSGRSPCVGILEPQMKVLFNREEMAAALGAVSGVTSARTPKPILQCVRLEAQSDVVLFLATDLELGLRYAASQVEVHQPGEVVVRADTLAQIVRECADETLALDTQKNQLHIRGAGSHFQIVTHAAGDFPPVAVMEGEPDFSLEQGELRRLIEWTVFASARESSRYAINGVLWEFKKEKSRVTLVATDGRRLSLARGSVRPSESAADRSVIVPPRALSLFGRVSADPEAVVFVKLSPNQVVLNLGRATISSSLVEGNFPEYERVVPQDNNKEAELDTAEFTSALKRAALLTSEESKAVKMSFNDGALVLTSRAPEQGEASITIPANFRGEPLEIGFNPVFLLDVLRVTPTDKITGHFRETNRPGILRISDDFLYVVMPVSLAPS